jgi:hypothetical protein
MESGLQRVSAAAQSKGIRRSESENQDLEG